MGLISKLLKAFMPDEETQRLLDSKRIKTYVAGTSHYQDAIEDIYLDIDDYEEYNGYTTREMREMCDGERKYKIPYHTFIVSNTKLELEHNNKYNSKAIKVISNGLHVGYVPNDDLERVHKILDCITAVHLYAKGGEYKEAVENPETFNTRLKTGSLPLGFMMEILYYKE
ncbi:MULTISPECIES: hypothetical protein [Peptostreptococcus]|nr:MULTISPECIES: hypothetical protein [Peptostreptococcus]MBS5595846.1 HIRAN domain-containing protein [Peptostreptococcus sp.]MDU1598202.1 hypothetical protein [Peptostreptococcus anaerobius]MDU1681777.1 hypothetical protein [Peptostreptococcus anaerobius]